MSMSLLCRPCNRSYQIRDGIPDFYISESDHDFSEDPNIIWLDPKIVEARDTYYKLCTRELKGMIFCMTEIGRRTSRGCHILEVGMGTGHFTDWLAEVSAPGTAIYAFDFSWPIIEKAKAKMEEWTRVTLFRANSREELPFQPGSFDIVFVRLAPLGPSGVPNVQVAFELLKPGGWFFGAGWERQSYEIPPTELAIQHGYVSASNHEWQYLRVQTEEEWKAMQIEEKPLFEMMEKKKGIDLGARTRNASGYKQGAGEQFVKMTMEHVLMAQKPG
jgi:SAM-dependent methyltransferase